MSAFVYLNNEEIRSEFYSCVKDYFDHPFFPSLITFQWNDLSTGEINFLNILSRLFEIKRLSDAKHVVFMIDEGDITLHPEWQRQYISFLVQNIGLLFPGLTYQMIITTHSPIILSDIPNFDIKYMNAESSQAEMKTFGSNIIDLYAKPFVMNHVMGDFAKKKIEKLLGNLYTTKKELVNNKLSITIREYQKFVNQISIIGDEVISKRLTEILDSIPQNNQTLRMELEAAKKRVSDLENKLEN
jgi:hypothetical protein